MSGWLQHQIKLCSQIPTPLPHQPPPLITGMWTLHSCHTNENYLHTIDCELLKKFYLVIWLTTKFEAQTLWNAMRDLWNANISSFILVGFLFCFFAIVQVQSWLKYRAKEERPQLYSYFGPLNSGFFLLSYSFVMYGSLNLNLRNNRVFLDIRAVDDAGGEYNLTNPSLQLGG